MLGQRLVLVTLYRGLQLVLSKTLGIGDTIYHIQCTYVIWVKIDTLSKMLQPCITANDIPH